MPSMLRLPRPKQKINWRNVLLVISLCLVALVNPEKNGHALGSEDAVNLRARGNPKDTSRISQNLFGEATVHVYFPAITRVIPGKYREFSIRELPYNEKPYTYDTPSDLDADFPADENGVPMFIYKGKAYYHPVRTANFILHYLDSYHLTGNAEYLRRAEIFASKLIEIGTHANGAIYFPYDFDIPIHGVQNEILIAPWYSGMAQGQALSAFVRLYNITLDGVYLNAADLTFYSFKNVGREFQPWTVFLDSQGYYWIEEYPWQEPTQVLNGFIFGIYGLYDYYLLKGDNESHQLIQASLTTILEYISSYRNPGGISFYCLRHKHLDPLYHTIHIDQLRMLHHITGESDFADMADLFYADYHE
jgi:hypothetical protein